MWLLTVEPRERGVVGGKVDVLHETVDVGEPKAVTVALYEIVNSVLLYLVEWIAGIGAGNDVVIHKLVSQVDALRMTVKTAVATASFRSLP